ncbi:hypothetical protein [Streptomyces sp. NPDC054887]
MVQLTPLSSLPYPQPADAANVPLHLQSLAEAVDGRTVLRVASTVALSSVAAPVTGMLAWVTSPGRYYYYTGSYWHPVIPSPVVKLNPVAGTTASATYIEALTGSTGDAMAAAFTAPPSGAVLVTVGARISSSVSTGAGYMSMTVKQGTTVTLATADTRAAVFGGGMQCSVSTQFQVSGLSGGVAYTATPAYRSSATTSTATFANRFLRVDPVH